MNNPFKRQTNIVKPKELDFPILLIGCGSVGSWAGLALAKMGCSDITLVDFDVVEEHNIPSQAYFFNQINNNQIKRNKVDELSKNMRMANVSDEWTYNPYCMSFEEFFKQSTTTFPFIICAVDSMDERIKLWEIIKKRDDVDCFLDVRVGGELLRMYATDPLDVPSRSFYEKNLYPSIKADPLPCGSRSIIYTTIFAGALVANMVKKYAKKESLRAETIIDFSNMTII